MDTLDVAKPNISGTRRNGKFPPKNDFKRQDPSNSSQILWKNIDNHVAPPLNLSEKTFGVKNIQRVWCGKFGGQAFASQLSFGKLYWFWKIYCIPADTFRRGAAVHFQMLARRHGLHNHQFSAPFVFFCFVPMDFALNTTKKGFRKTSTDGWMTAHWNIHCGQGLERRKPSVTIVLDSAEVLSQTIRTTLWWALRNYDIFQHLIYILFFVDKQKLNKHSCSACFRSKSVRNKGAFEHTLVPHVLGKPCRRLNIETGHQGTEGSQSVRRGRFCKRTYRSRTSSSSCVCAKVPQNLPHLEKHVPFLKEN